MSSNIVNQMPYLRTSRNFPQDNPQALSVELNRAYVDTAAKMNDRSIGLFPMHAPAITGEQWFFSGSNSKQQTLRQIFTFTGAGNIPHGIVNLLPGQVTHNSYGSYTDGTSSFGVIYASSVGLAGQVTFYVNATNIVVLVDGGAPVVSTGFIVLEWLSQT